MNKKKVASVICLFGIITIIITSVYIKYTEQKNQEDYEYIRKLIIATAKECKEKNLCTSDDVTLSELYEKLGSNTFVNPFSGEAFNEKSYVTSDELFIEI